VVDVKPDKRKVGTRIDSYFAGFSNFRILIHSWTNESKGNAADAVDRPVKLEPAAHGARDTGHATITNGRKSDHENLVTGHDDVRPSVRTENRTFTAGPAVATVGLIQCRPYAGHSKLDYGGAVVRAQDLDHANVVTVIERRPNDAVLRQEVSLVLNYGIYR
jgi:hypothetical protein